MGSTMKLAVVPTICLVVWWSCIQTGSARTFHDALSKKSKCPHLTNEGLHAVLDRVCEECFVMFRFKDPDVGAKCKQKCFKNDYYKWCAAALSNNELPYPDDYKG